MLFVGLLVIGIEAYHPHYLDWALGAIVGALIALWVDVSDSPPWYIEKWRRGAEGERRTARALRPLKKEGWLIIHDLPCNRGNRDHVLLGPAGVVLLDSKWPDGEVSVEGDALKVHRPADPTSNYVRPHLGDAMRGAARDLNHELSAAGARCWVHAGVVVWGSLEQGLVEGDRVTFVHGDEVVAWLQSLPRRLLPERQEAVAQALAEITPPQPGALRVIWRRWTASRR